MSSWLSYHPGFQPVKPWLNTLWSERGSGHLSMELRGTLIRCKAVTCPQRFWESRAVRADAAQWSSTCSQNRPLFPGGKGAGAHTTPQEAKSNVRIPWLSPRGHRGHQASKAERRVYLPMAGDSMFSRVGTLRPLKHVFEKNLRDHPIQTHFEDGQISVKREEGCVHSRPGRTQSRGWVTTSSQSRFSTWRRLSHSLTSDFWILEAYDHLCAEYSLDRCQIYQTQDSACAGH